MAMTMTQKILAAKANLPEVKAQQIIKLEVDLALGNDVTSPLAIEEFKKIGQARVHNRDKIALVPDHFTPNKDIKAAEQCKLMREFSREQEISHYYELGEMGIEHVLIPEEGLALPGEVIIGADSHTCTYGALGAFSTGVGSTDLAAAMATGKCWLRVPSALKFILKGKPQKWVGGKDIILHIIGEIGVDGARYKSMEFFGDGLEHLTMDSRFTITNMAIEAGAKNGIFPVDEQTLAFIKDKAKRDYQIFTADKEAYYDEEYVIDISQIKPTVACPHLPENTCLARELAAITLDQVVIGSCTNGRMEDLRIAASILEGKKIHRGLRLIVFPGTQKIYLEALREGLLEVLLEAGAVVSTPSCGPCLGGHLGVLAKGERALATTNRNFVGRMGHPQSEVYLAGPAVAAASALAGRIVDPQEMIRGGKDD